MFTSAVLCVLLHCIWSPIPANRGLLYEISADHHKITQSHLLPMQSMMREKSKKSSSGSCQFLFCLLFLHWHWCSFSHSLLNNIQYIQQKKREREKKELIHSKKELKRSKKENFKVIVYTVNSTDTSRYNRFLWHNRNTRKLATNERS